MDVFKFDDYFPISLSFLRVSCKADSFGKGCAGFLRFGGIVLLIGCWDWGRIFLGINPGPGIPAEGGCLGKPGLCWEVAGPFLNLLLSLNTHIFNWFIYNRECYCQALGERYLSYPSQRRK